MAQSRVDKKASAGSRPKIPAAGAPGTSPLVATGGVLIETERLTIRPLRDAYPHHIGALNNKQHMRFSEQRHLIHDRATQEAYVRSANPDKVLLDLILRSTNQSIGSITCYLDWLNMTCDMGLMIVPEQARQGFGCEAWAAVMDHWLKQGFKVEAGMMAPNTAMGRICRASGMLHEGYRPRHFLVDGEPVALKMYGKSP